VKLAKRRLESPLVVFRLDKNSRNGSCGVLGTERPVAPAFLVYYEKGARMTASSEVISSRVRFGITEIVCGLRRDLYAEFRAGVLKAFVDDSGSGGDSKWFVLAGYVGTVEAWDRFDPLWLSVLYQSPRIEYFKSKEAIHRHGQLRGFTEEQRDAKLDALVNVIGDCADRAFCARVRQSDYNELVKGQIPERYDSAYYFLFPFFIGAVVNMERLDGLSEPTEFVFDSDERFERLAYEMVPKLMPLKSFSGGIVSVLYRNDKEFLPLQAADLLAWQIRRAFSVTKEPRRKHFDAARLRPRKEPHTFIVTRDMLGDMMAEAKDKIARFAESIGRPISLRDL
jgi:hypothetical protein